MKSRLSEKKVQSIINEWNSARNLVYRNKGFLMLSNDGNHRFLTQISKEGGTCVEAIATDGTLRDCLNQMYQAENHLLEKKL